MTSKIWPPPNEVEQAQIDDVVDNPFQEECSDCEQWPCICDWCADCGCEDCECETCDTCGYAECECTDCYVVYYTRVTVRVDSDGDLTGVTVSSELGNADDVEDEGGDSVRGPLRERALNAARLQDWPSWDIE